MIIKQNLYNGDFIHKRFAYKYYRKDINPTGNIVIFRAPMIVDTNLIDLEDSLQKDYIASDDAINFCWEIPNLCPLGAVAFQRLFNTGVATILGQYINKPIEVDGDDLMVHDTFVGSDKKQYDKGKVSVSITYSTNNIAIGHTGININAGTNAPGFAYSTHLNDDQCNSFMQNINQYFYEITNDMFIATTKIIV
jgi:hypothetical protein